MRYQCARLVGLGFLMQLLHITAAIKLELQPKESQCVQYSIGTDYVQFHPDELLIEAAISIMGIGQKRNYNSALGVSVKLTGPDSALLHSNRWVWQESKISVKAKHNQGTYSLCFEAGTRGFVPVVVHLISFAATHSTPAQAVLNPPKGTGVQRGADLANHMHLTELHDDIMRVRDQLDSLHSDQVYYNSRVERHMQTNQEIHWRTFLYPILEVVVTGSTAAIQVYIIHRLFSRRTRRQFAGRSGV